MMAPGNNKFYYLRFITIIALSICIAIYHTLAFADTLSTVEKKIYIVNQWSDLNHLTKKTEKGAEKKRHIKKIELLRVIPRKGNNPFDQRDPINNTYDPQTGIVEYRAVDEETVEEETKTSPQPQPQPEQCDAAHLNLCTTAETCVLAGGYWTDFGCKTCPDGEGYFETVSGKASVYLVVDTFAEKWGRGFRAFADDPTNNPQYEFVARYDLVGDVLRLGKLSPNWTADTSLGSAPSVITRIGRPCTYQVRVDILTDSILVHFKTW